MSDSKNKMDYDLKAYDLMCEHATKHLEGLITGAECVDSNEILAVAKTVGEIVDVKKDIVEMHYKQAIIDAMEEGGEVYGYNANRYSNGRYAPRYGYKRYIDDDMEDYSDNMRMGYHKGTSVYGEAYDAYNMARRNYTETNEASYKSRMKESAKEHIKNTNDSLMEMYRTGDAETKNMIRESVQRMLNGMN